ncbi:hypothetical protein LTR49_017935 [Elasticomyces elasticus]|nr:hypothetical protein LTR49_017935 [Elasticomyces elasticus]KAK5757998.1 hypothetical protein LTS12_011893 [Elasticomyces elasticus]
MHLFGTPDWELAYDKQTEEFERCLALCRSYVSFSTTANGSPQVDRPTTTAFSLNAGVIPALYFIALKCREPSVRHEAQSALLGTGPYREGWWEAQKAATVAATAMKMEEADIEPKCAADVPASNRLNTATVMRIWQGMLPPPKLFDVVATKLSSQAWACCGPTHEEGRVREAQ